MMTLYLRWDTQVRPLQIDHVTSFSMAGDTLSIWVYGLEYIYPKPDSFAAGVF